MKRLNVLLIVIVCLSVCLSSCKKEKPEIVQWKGKYSIWYWDEDLSVSYEPGGAIWFTPTPAVENHWYPLKRFNTTEELKFIIEKLTYPQQKSLNPELAGREKLLVWLLDRHLKKTKTVVVNFYLDNDSNEFVGPKGKDKRLWKLLHDKEQCENWYGSVEDATGINVIYSDEYRAHWDEYRERDRKEKKHKKPK